MSKSHFSNPVGQRPVVRVRADWSGATRRLIAGTLCVVCAGALFMPDAALAAEWVNVDGTQYDAGAAAGDEAGTWSWDGADDMKLNGYDGGAIEAEGKLNVSYSGNNTVTNDDGNGILVTDGANENAELNIQGGASSTLNVTSSGDAIWSEGDINIDGAGTVNATSTEADAVDAKGDLTIKGSGTVNATGDSDGIRADGNITIDNSGTVTAKATDDQGIDANENPSLNASGVGYGIYVYKGVTLDGATVTVRASAGSDEVIALYTDEDDIVIKNGSTVDAFAEGKFSAAISTRNYSANNAGGHIYISDSVVKAIARYVENGGDDSDGPDHYNGDQDGETIPESEGLNIGIFAQTYKGITPATISIVRSKVTAEGDTAAIFALAMSEDGKAIGTIEIKDAIIQTPEGGKVIDYRHEEELSDGISYEAGQTIGTGDATIDSPYNEAVAKSTVIAPPEEAKPEEKPGETKPEETKPEETKPEVKPAEQQTPATSSKAKPAAAKKGLPVTGDASLAGYAATAFAGASALLAGLFKRRRG